MQGRHTPLTGTEMLGHLTHRGSSAPWSRLSHPEHAHPVGRHIQHKAASSLNLSRYMALELCIASTLCSMSLPVSE